jgi:PAP2 superfamily
MKALSAAVLPVLSALALALPGAVPAAGHDRSAAVTRWISVDLAEIAAHRTNPPRAARGLALLSVAIDDASRVSGKHRRAAIAGAATTVLTYLYPDRADALEALAADERPQVALEWGRRLGARYAAYARTDGSDAVWQGTVPIGPGLWVPTPPAFAPPLEPLAGTWRTWNISSGSRFRPGPPPAFGSKRYAREVREVYDVSQALTTKQKRIADFWSDGAGTITPPGHWNAIALDLIRSHRLSDRAAAHLLAALNTAQADAFIACWDAKYTYWSERPPFPSYVSGHSTTSGAASTVLAARFPDAARKLRAWADEAAVSRLYGGIHFRSDNQTGLALGKKVGRVAVMRYAIAQ